MAKSNDHDKGFAVNEEGGHIHPKNDLLNPDEFGDKMKDKTQGGSGFEQGGGGSHGNYTDEDIDNMSDEEFMEHRDEIYESYE